MSTALSVIRDYRNKHPEKSMEIYTAKAMYYGNGDKFFKEGESTEFTFNKLLNILNDLTVVSVYASGQGTIWSLPGSDVRGEYIYGVNHRLKCTTTSSCHVDNYNCSIS
jgi:hypothetical protein